MQRRQFQQAIDGERSRRALKANRVPRERLMCLREKGNLGQELLARGKAMGTAQAVRRMQMVFLPDYWSEAHPKTRRLQP